jgi:hypothetical protein
VVDVSPLHSSSKPRTYPQLAQVRSEACRGFPGRKSRQTPVRRTVRAGQELVEVRQAASRAKLRSARRLSATDRGLLPGVPAFTRAGLAPAGLVQFSGRNMTETRGPAT